MRHKCQFCLSFCSVFIVVLSVLVVNSVIAKGPVIFLKLSEVFIGEYDGIFYNRKFDGDDKWLAGVIDNGYYINYNNVQNLEDFGKHNLAPRYQTCDVDIYAGDLSNNNLVSVSKISDDVNLDSMT